VSGASRLPGAPLTGRRLPGERHVTSRAGGQGRAGHQAELRGDADPDGPLVGVLALQGDVLEHVRALRAIGARTVAVRSPTELAAVDALVLPGGESTTMSRLLVLGELLGPLVARLQDGMPILGTCAGLILLSEELADEALPRPGGLAVRTRRNAYGAQTSSFDTVVDVAGVDGGPMEASFIRAPRIEEVLSEEVEVLASVAGHPVVVQQGALLAMSFHPEVTGDLRLHEHFVRDMVVGGAR
jgi:pyridoxal 5'-phosphate synthase pdxT subunit